MSQNEVVIVGAGVIGLSTAFSLALAGCSVVVIDPFPGHGASFVAAGMIAPTTEAVYGEERLVELSVQAARLWPSFNEQVEAYTHLSTGLNLAGTLFVATNNNDREQIRNLLPLYQQLGLAASWCSSTEIRRRQPLLSPMVRGGIDALSDVQVDNRRLLASLVDAIAHLGVTVVRSRVSSLLVEHNRVVGVTTESDAVSCSTVVIAAGWQSNTIEGIPVAERPQVRPVKGQIVRLMQHDPTLRVDKTIRALVAGRSVYVVPRQSGQVVIGATVEEKGPDFRATAGAAYELLRDAIAVVPALAEAEIQSIDVGLRPGTLDNAPHIGSSRLNGLIYATGHYRHGVLLAPITAQAIREIVSGGGPPDWVASYAPDRKVQS